MLKALAETLRLDYAQFLELEVFTRFGTMVDERTRKKIELGRRIRAVLVQRQFAPLSLGEQVALLVALADGVLDTLPIDRIDDFRERLLPCLAECCPEIITLDDKAEAFPVTLRTRLLSCTQELARETSDHNRSSRGYGSSP